MLIKIYFRGGSLTKVKSRQKGMCESEPKMRTVHRGGMRVKESYGGSLAVVVVIIVEIEKKKTSIFSWEWSRRQGWQRWRGPVFMKEREQEDNSNVTNFPLSVTESSYIVTLTHFLFWITIIKICRRFDYPVELNINALDGSDCLCCSGGMSFIILHILVDHCPDDSNPILKYLCL